MVDAVVCPPRKDPVEFLRDSLVESAINKCSRLSQLRLSPASEPVTAAAAAVFEVPNIGVFTFGVVRIDKVPVPAAGGC